MWVFNPFTATLEFTPPQSTVDLVEIEAFAFFVGA